MNRLYYIALFICALLCGCTADAVSNVVTSPDGRIAVSVDVNGEGTPIYNLTFDGEAIIENSPLGIVTSAVDFTSGLQLVAINHSSSNTTWEPVWGERAVVVDKYNSIDATFKSADGNEIVIVLRVYDDGLGMRYRILGDGSHYVMNETTTFSFVEDCEAHWIAGSYDDDEYAYMHTPMSGITLENMALSSSGNRKLPYPSVNTPVTLITSKGTHVALHEAALWDYPAMSLRYDAETNSFISDLASVQEIKAPVELPFATPWRVVIIGDRAGALVESTIVLNLNEPCRLEDTSWIKPMKYVGVWWEMHLKLSTWDCDGSAPHCATTENVKRYIDFAAENGFDTNKMSVSYIGTKVASKQVRHATAKVDKRLKEMGIKPREMNREEWLEQAWNWKHEYANTIHEQWAKLEAAGAVFLPAAGQRAATKIEVVDERGYYWSATEETSDTAFLILFSSNTATLFSPNRFRGNSVRLVRDL